MTAAATAADSTGLRRTVVCTVACARAAAALTDWAVPPEPPDPPAATAPGVSPGDEPDDVLAFSPSTLLVTVDRTSSTLALTSDLTSSLRSCARALTSAL